MVEKSKSHTKEDATNTSHAKIYTYMYQSQNKSINKFLDFFNHKLTNLRAHLLHISPSILFQYNKELRYHYHKLNLYNNLVWWWWRWRWRWRWRWWWWWWWIIWRRSRSFRSWRHPNVTWVAGFIRSRTINRATRRQVLLFPNQFRSIGRIFSIAAENESHKQQCENANWDFHACHLESWMEILCKKMDSDDDDDDDIVQNMLGFL